MPTAAFLSLDTSMSGLGAVYLTDDIVLLHPNYWERHSTFTKNADAIRKNNREGAKKIERKGLIMLKLKKLKFSYYNNFKFEKEHHTFFKFKHKITFHIFRTNILSQSTYY